MSNETPPAIPRRKRSITRYLVISFLLLVGFFTFQLFGPTPPILLSKQTTYITSPLRPDGLPDYVAYLRDQLRAGVTPENNAAVAMWQAFGPEGNDAAALADWQHLTSELQLPPAKSPRYLDSPDDSATAGLVEQWLVANDPAWKQAVENPPAVVDGEPLPEDLGYDIIYAARSAPWRGAQLPPLAAWAEANRAPLDLLVAGARRPHFYTPFSLPDDETQNSLIEVMDFDSISYTRNIARCLTLRAMHHTGEGRHEAAWQDLLATHRWARLTARGPTIVDQLVAIAIDGIAAASTQALLGEKLPPELARQIQADLLALGPASDMAHSFDVGERLYFLDAVVNGREQGLGSFLSENVGFGDEPNQLQPLDFISADWNATLLRGNQIYDQLVAASRLPTHAARHTEFNRVAGEIQRMELETRGIKNWTFGAISPAKRSNMLAAAVITLLSPVFGASNDAEDRGNTTLQLTQLAAALAVYRADHGNYPDRLEQLVPDVIGELPVDLYHAKPFIYRRDAEGYLLYTTGPNATDDGGSNDQFGGGILKGREVGWKEDPATEKLRKQIPPGADDSAIRVPAPPFKLPTPPPPPTKP